MFKKNGCQDRRRCDKYEVNTEKTNKPNTANPKITTIIGSPLNTFL